MAPIIAPNIIRLTIELMGRAFVIKYKREVIKITITETAPQRSELQDHFGINHFGILMIVM